MPTTGGRPEPGRPFDFGAVIPTMGRRAHDGVPWPTVGCRAHDGMSCHYRLSCPLRGGHAHDGVSRPLEVAMPFGTVMTTSGRSCPRWGVPATRGRHALRDGHDHFG